LAAGDPGKCVSDLQALLDDNRPYPGITVDGYFGSQTPRAVVDFQSAHNLLAEVFRAMSGRRASGDPPSQELNRR
jgi:peptidoglycan hydrolase-like protein with peptidoglycan-binding domain